MLVDMSHLCSLIWTQAIQEEPAKYHKNYTHKTSIVFVLVQKVRTTRNYNVLWEKNSEQTEENEIGMMEHHNIDHTRYSICILLLILKRHASTSLHVEQDDWMDPPDL